MANTREFRETVQERVARDPKFRRALFVEALRCFIAGEVDLAKSVLRSYIKATGGFEKLSDEVSIPSKSLDRMFSPRGNPQAKNLFAVISHLQKEGRIPIVVKEKLRA